LTPKGNKQANQDAKLIKHGIRQVGWNRDNFISISLQVSSCSRKRAVGRS